MGLPSNVKSSIRFKISTKPRIPKSFLLPYERNRILYQITRKKTHRFQKASQGIARWLNQNYVIRLYVIMDHYQIIKHENSSDIITLIKLMRNNNGAHSVGRSLSSKRKKELLQAAEIIQKLFDKKIEPTELDGFPVAVDSVLLPIKNETSKLIKSLEQ